MEAVLVLVYLERLEEVILEQAYLEHQEAMISVDMEVAEAVAVGEEEVVMGKLVDLEEIARLFTPLQISLRFSCQFHLHYQLLR